MSSNTVWFITGSSTGLGRVLAEELLKSGYRVSASARKPEVLADLKKKFGDKVLVPTLDVTKPEEVKKAIDATLKHFGSIDVVVNNAGYGLMGAVEEVKNDEIRQQFETNFFGALDVVRQILPHFRKQKSGWFINMSSIAGFRGSAGAGLYNSTKFALEGLSEAMSKELAHLGIKVLIVEPGPFRTDFAGRSVVMTQLQIEDYAPSAGKMREYIRAADGTQVGDPAKAAHAMIQAVESSNPPLRLPLGPFTLSEMRIKIDRVQKDIADWEKVAMDSSFPE